MLILAADGAGKTFDFVIVGGGTAGLTLASRLSEDPGVTVAVLEAGQPNLSDPFIEIPAQYGLTFGNPKYDWAHQTVPQEKADGRTIAFNRGKGLGGSSALNFLDWTKPAAADIDAIGALGNPGWSWENFMKYSLLTETFDAADEEQMLLYPHTYRPEYRGTSGPVHVTVPHHLAALDHLFQDTLSSMNIKLIDDAMGGDNCGMWMAPNNVDRKAWKRSYATTAYYKPSEHRSNLQVVTDALVTQVLFEEGHGQTGNITAKGIKFISEGKQYAICARKEVILAAGAIKTPQILELSGIGNPEALSKVGIECLIELPGVGENVQEHMRIGVAYELNDSNYETFDRLLDPVYAAKALQCYNAGEHSLYRMGLTSHAFLTLESISKDFPSLVESLQREIDRAKVNTTALPGLAEQLDLQMNILKDPTVPDTEFLVWPGLKWADSPPDPEKSYVTINMMLEHPFSRGNIHISTEDPTVDPRIDARLYDFDFDVQLMAEEIKFARKLAETEPFKSAVVSEISPGPDCVTDAQIQDYIRRKSLTTWHALGSTSMLPRAKGGVVDPTFKVYGTTNLRVVDLGVIPLQLACHTQSVVYAIAEKAADVITGKQRV